MVRANNAFERLADSAYVREWDLVSRSGERDPALLPFSKSTLWRHIRAGSFPAPVKLSERVTAWRVGDVRQWLLKFQGDSQPTTVRV